LPFSTALDNILLGLVLLGWVVGGVYAPVWRARWQQVSIQPVAWVFLGVIALFAVGLLYGERAPGDGLDAFSKYAHLAATVVLITLFGETQWRRRAVLALTIGLAALLLISYCIRLGVIPPNTVIKGTPDNPIVWKEWITHGVLMALGAFLFAQLAQRATTARARWLWFALTLLAVGNVLFLTQGRVGYLVLGVLTLYAGYLWRRSFGIAVGVCGFAALVGIAIVTPSALHQRSELALQEFAQSQPGVAAHTSIGMRMEFYRNTLALIEARPILGNGTGGFRQAYAEKVAGTGMIATNNPHNDYLLMMAQLGLPGLVALLLMLATPWRQARGLATAFDTHMARALVIALAIGGLVYSPLIDHTEQLLFIWGIGILFGGWSPAPAAVQAT
jgi:O-antigen ligase